MDVKFFSNSHWRLSLHNFTKSGQSLELIDIVIVIDIVIGGFSGKDLKWGLAHVTVRL